jgi:CBS domain containing-hemolysin-like protein
MSFMVANFISVAVLLGLFMLGTYFSAAEMAFSSLNRARIKSMADAGGRRGRRAQLAFDMHESRFDEIISTILIGNNIVAITSATVAVSLFVRLIGDWGYFVATVLISAIIIVLTDIIPKSLAKEQPERVAVFVIPFLAMLMTLFKPITWCIIHMKNKLSSSVTAGDDEDDVNMVEQELLFMVEEASEAGDITDEDSQRISNAIEFHDVLAGDIITPRVNIVSVPITATVEEMADVFLDSGYSRLPVYEDSQDQIKGIVHIRDFLRCMATSQTDNPVQLADIITPPVFTVPGARVTDVIALLKNEKSHMAIIADEYGGTEGLITMEDILEQLVGEIWDENDEIIEEIVTQEDNSIKVLCTTDIDKLFDHFDMEAESDSNTVSGWIMEQLRRIPEAGDTFTWRTLHVTVTKTEGNIAEECVIRIIEKSEETENAENNGENSSPGQE